jgi:hypothetical protein
VCVPVIEWIAAYYLNPVINEMLQQSSLYDVDSQRHQWPTKISA